MQFYNGRNRLLYIKLDGAWMPVGSLTSNNISESSETVPTTTRENGGWISQRPVRQNYVIDFSGLQINTAFALGDFTRMSYDYLKILKRQRVLIEWKIATNDNLYVDYGSGYITGLNEESTVDSSLKFSGTILGQGEPTFTTEREIYLDEGTGELMSTGEANELISGS